MTTLMDNRSCYIRHAIENVNDEIKDPVLRLLCRKVGKGLDFKVDNFEQRQHWLVDIHDSIKEQDQIWLGFVAAEK
jgi:hypothetical protein